MFANWQANGIITIRSGLPFTVSTGTDTANTASSGTYRPDLVKTPTADCGRGHLVGCIDPTAFTIASLYPANPNNYAYGNAGRNIPLRARITRGQLLAGKELPDLRAGPIPIPVRDIQSVQPCELRKSLRDDQYIVIRKYHGSRAGHQQPPDSARRQNLLLIAATASSVTRSRRLPVRSRVLRYSAR